MLDSSVTWAIIALRASARDRGRRAPCRASGAAHGNVEAAPDLALLGELGAEPAPSVAPPSFMVFFDWDRSNLSQQALTTIQQA
jgi:hypothetical protein